MKKYWVWRGHANEMAQWEKPCKQYVEPIDYRLEDRQDIYLATEVDMLLSDTRIFLERLCGEGDELTASARVTLATRLLDRLR